MCRLIIVIIHLCAACVPMISSPARIETENRGDPRWPEEFEGVALRRIPISDEERGFYEGFPGVIARFSAADRELVIRTVRRPTRKLHPAADCLRGSGYQVSPLPARRDPENRLWGCVLAEKSASKLRVCEKIEDFEGRSWYDVSSWYWAALLGRSTGPWQAVTIADRI